MSYVKPSLLFSFNFVPVEKNLNAAMRNLKGPFEILFQKRCVNLRDVISRQSKNMLDFA